MVRDSRFVNNMYTWPSLEMKVNIVDFSQGLKMRRCWDIGFCKFVLGRCLINGTAWFV